MPQDVIVEKVRDGKRAAARIPYEVRGDDIVIDHMTLVGAVALLNEAMPPPPINCGRPARRRRRRGRDTQ